MIETVSQKEQRNPGPRIVSLGEEFFPFSPTDTFYRWFDKSTFILGIDKAKISFTIHTPSSRTRKMDAITPFDPELGYQIDSQDMQLETRMAKIENLRGDLEQMIELKKALFYLNINAGLSQEINARQVDEDGVNSELSTAMPEISRRLRVLVSFPKGRYESRPNSRRVLTDDEVVFDNFYPIDTGPLPRDNSFFSDLDEGFSLYLPDDPKKLSQIKVMFILAEEEPKKVK